jgi:hypothetical protein
MQKRTFAKTPQFLFAQVLGKKTAETRKRYQMQQRSVHFAPTHTFFLSLTTENQRVDFTNTQKVQKETMKLRKFLKLSFNVFFSRAKNDH